MLSGVGIICFAASYAVTLVLEITRLFFRSGVRGAIMLGFAGAGLFAHTAYLYYRVVNATGSPLSSSQDWCLVAAWVLAATYLYLTSYHPKAAFGLFVLPLVLGLIGAGTFLADPEPYARGPASQVWGIVHGTSILLATVAVLVGFAAGLMYLGQAYRLKHKLPPRRGLRLPSLEWLRRANSRTIGIALLMLGAGILSGMILNLIHFGPEAERLPWHDPVVLSTLVMFGWLVASAGIGVFYKPAREGHKVAFFTVFSFVFLVIALALVLFGNTKHGGPRDQRGKPRRSVEGSGFGVQGSGFRVQGLGLAEVCSLVKRAGPSAGDNAPAWPPGLNQQCINYGARCAHGAKTLQRRPLVPTPYSPPTANRQAASSFRYTLPTARCLLPTAYCLLPTAHRPLSSRRAPA